MVINTTFQSVHGAGEFQMAGPYRLLFPLRVRQPRGKHAGLQRDNHLDPWTLEKEDYALHWLVLKVHVVLLTTGRSTPTWSEN